MLEAVRVTKHLAGTPALKGVDFLLERGQVHGLAGVDGAGKSTLVKVLTGVYQPDQGLLFHKGEPVRFKGTQDAQQRGISTVHQDARPAGALSVSASLFRGREPRNRLGLVCSRHMHQAASRLLESLGIFIDPRQELRSLSPDIQKMVAIARAVNTDARIVIMDEPASSLEPSDIDTLFDVIRGLHERDVAVIYVSHQLDELYQICNRITVLRDGEAVHTGLMSGISPAGLVAAMLGRRPDAVRRESLAAFTGKHEAARSSVLKAEKFFRHAHE
ncbi:ABC-type sugar transport system ATPase subunit [Kibdelosporangium banguiense]|uniref:ABC-type sugar transport system ATPase subunit n=1 Tax=Kibdelosporangium banguiense TaxID=1365924 RepID=A0ABS4THQ0_9PSEU|nr:ATP-binding cassette domain-containing protein [Kibdelosporangium banguiense]MBP2323871.1 ABC-type sugar transport system ATPase subunit [Kibdelosporangium banguiense]